MANRISKIDLINEIALHNVLADTTKKDVTALVNYIFDTITEHIVAGDSVHVSGFGKFENFTRQNGANAAKFRPAKALKDAVAEVK